MNSNPLRWYCIHTNFGWITMVKDEISLKRVLLTPEPTDISTAMGKPTEGMYIRDREFDDLIARIREYCNGNIYAFDDIRINLDGCPPFTKAVLEACQNIPPGETRSYQDLAKIAGSPRGFRAVGRVMANNPLMLVIPCHRVVTVDGAMGGYQGGTHIKYELLRFEHDVVELKHDRRLALDNAKSNKIEYSRGDRNDLGHVY